MMIHVLALSALFSGSASQGPDSLAGLIPLAAAAVRSIVAAEKAVTAIGPVFVTLESAARTVSGASNRGTSEDEIAASLGPNQRPYGGRSRPIECGPTSSGRQSCTIREQGVSLKFESMNLESGNVYCVVSAVVGAPGLGEYDLLFLRLRLTFARRGTTWILSTSEELLREPVSARPIPARASH
jgi:hypothetical protein